MTVLESDEFVVGGLARTLKWNGYRFDIGAHRFFTKNSEIGRWWHARLPNDFIRIKRLTRIFYRGRLFQYPLRPDNALFGLGLRSSAACVISYLRRKVRPNPFAVKYAESLEVQCSVACLKRSVSSSMRTKCRYDFIQLTVLNRVRDVAIL